MTHFDHLIRTARTQNFTVNIDNYEVEIYAPDATISAVFNRNDAAQMRSAREYILSHFRRAAWDEQDAIRRALSL